MPVQAASGRGRALSGASLALPVTYAGKNPDRAWRGTRHQRECEMQNYGLLVVAVVMAIVVGLGFWWIWGHSASEGPASPFDCLLLWPLIFRAERQGKKRTRRGFVIFGVLLGVGPIATDMYFNGNHGHRSG